MLKPAHAVPALAVDVLDTARFDIHAARPKEFTLLAFYRGLHCPACKAWLHKLDGLAGEFRDLGVEPIALSTDSIDRARTARDDWGLKTLPVGYGLPIDTARAWGLAISESIAEKEPPWFAEPGVFLVRPDATLYMSSIQTTTFGRAAFDDILSGVRFVIEKQYPPRGTA